MKESGDVLQVVEGLDEKGEAKAISCLMIEYRSGDASLTPQIHRLAYMRHASVRVSLTGGFAVVDLGFEDCADFDCLQALKLCREFTAMTETCEPEAKKDPGFSLMLFIAPKAEYDFLLMGTDAAWSYIPERTKGMSNTIRLVFAREKFGTYESDNIKTDRII